MSGLRFTDQDIARVKKAMRELGLVLDQFGRDLLAELEAKVGPVVRLVRQTHRQRRVPAKQRHRMWRIRQASRRRRRR